MTTDIPDLADAVRRYAADRQEATGPHLGVEELAAYDRGEVDDERRDRIREHLALCSECARWLLDLRGPAPDEPAGGDDAVAAVWRRERGTAWDEIQRRIGGLGDAASSDVETPQGDAGPVRPPAPSPSGHPVMRHWATSLLAAACVILAVLLWQARAEISRPGPVSVEMLTPEGAGTLRGSEEPGRAVFRPPAGQRLVLVLAYVGTGGREDFTAEIYPPTGEGPEHVIDVRRREDGTLAVELGPDPAPGAYRIVLYQRGGAEPREVATYRFRIGLPEPEP